MDTNDPDPNSQASPSIHHDDVHGPGSFMLDELAKAKRRTAMWKNFAVREWMREGRAGRDAKPIAYMAMELHSAADEAAHWDVGDDGRGNYLVERHS